MANVRITGDGFVRYATAIFNAPDNGGFHGIVRNADLNGNFEFIVQANGAPAYTTLPCA